MLQRTVQAALLSVGTTLVLICGVAPALAQNLLINGSFEEPVVAPGVAYVHRNGTELTGWTIYSTYKGAVHFNSPLYDPVTEGVQAVQIEYPGDWISQSFTTALGQSYTLSFDLSAYTVYGGPGLHACPCESFLAVTIGPVSAMLSGSSAGYVSQSLMFTAESTITTLMFKNSGEFGNYPHLDNVSVVAVGVVPEPEIYAMLSLGLGLIGWIGRKKKLKERAERFAV